MMLFSLDSDQAIYLINKSKFLSIYCFIMFRVFFCSGNHFRWDYLTQKLKFSNVQGVTKECVQGNHGMKTKNFKFK